MVALTRGVAILFCRSFCSLELSRWSLQSIESMVVVVAAVGCRSKVRKATVSQCLVVFVVVIRVRGLTITSQLVLSCRWRACEAEMVSCKRGKSKRCNIRGKSELGCSQ